MLNFLYETLRLGLKNLHLHKLRSLLTALGIIFGVAAVIVMVAIGNGAKLEARKQMDKLGAQNILIRSVKPPESNDASSRTQRVLEYGLKRIDVERIRQTVPGLAKVVELRDSEARVVRGDTRANAAAIGTTADIFSVLNLHLARGEYFTQIQFDQAQPVCVLGAVAARQLFPYQDPLGQAIQVGGNGQSIVLLTVIGVLEPTGLRAGADNVGIMQRDIDQDIYFPLKLSQQVFGDTFTRVQAGTRERKQIELTECWLQAARSEDVEGMSKVIENMLDMAHPGLRDVNIKAPIEILRNAERLNRIFNFVMVGIASLSLVVGGIGIMNIMLATVTERTREIGIRRALGAKQKHITLQFLIETTVISLAGGIIGIAIGMGGAKMVTLVASYFNAQYPTDITTWSVIVSFAVSGSIGVLFGLYPAVTAAKMDPIEALRHE
ncbi:MAG TPA: ABC transporter permease [Tepidisphaeraceae bacterium]|jgi:putative ABC transport system permease protein